MSHLKRLDLSLTWPHFGLWEAKEKEREREREREKKLLRLRVREMRLSSIYFLSLFAFSFSPSPLLFGFFLSLEHLLWSPTYVSFVSQTTKGRVKEREREREREYYTGQVKRFREGRHKLKDMDKSHLMCVNVLYWGGEGRQMKDGKVQSSEASYVCMCPHTKHIERDD